MDLQSHDGLCKLRALFRQNSKKLLETDLGGRPVALLACERKALAFHQHLTLMLLNHAAFTARYTLHFMLRDALAIVATKSGTKPEGITSERGVDYCREFCNLLVGSIVNGMLAQELFAVHSLPFAMQGYNDIFFASHGPGGIYDAYFLQSDLCRLGVSLDLSVSNADELDALKDLDTARIAASAFSGSFELL